MPIIICTTIYYRTGKKRRKRGGRGRDLTETIDYRRSSKNGAVCSAIDECVSGVWTGAYCFATLRIRVHDRMSQKRTVHRICAERRANELVERDLWLASFRTRAFDSFNVCPYISWPRTNQCTSCEVATSVPTAELRLGLYLIFVAGFLFQLRGSPL